MNMQANLSLCCSRNKSLLFLSHLLLAWRNIGTRFSICWFVHQCVNICVNPNFNPNIHVYFPRTFKATVMILGISLLLGMAI